MKKICEYCGKEFEAKSSLQRFCNDIHYVTCPVCGNVRQAKNKDELSRIMKTGQTACSYKCRAKRTKQTSINKYGCSAPGNNPTAREKAKRTMIDKFGVPYSLMSGEMKEKIKNTMKDRYGVDNPSKSKEILEKREITNKKRYGDKLPFNRPESYEKQHETIMKRYGVKYATEIPWVKNFDGHISSINKEFADKLNRIGIETKFEKYIDGKYFDIELIGKNILIEINPTYTHSSNEHYNIQGLYKNYHRDKTILAEKYGYKLIHIWDWDNKNLIIKSLSKKIDVQSDELKVYRLNKSETDKFLTENSLHGTCKNQNLSLGLVKDNIIYQVMTFGTYKHNNERGIKLQRMCTKLGYSVIGGYDKLSSSASQEFGVNECRAYIDRSKLYNNECEEIGMKLIKTNPPMKIWSKGKQYLTDAIVRNNKEKYDEQLMLENGWLPIYDCGQLVYEFKE